MKLLKIGEDFYHIGSIVKITPHGVGFFKIQLSDGGSIPVSELNLNEIFEFSGTQVLEIVKADIPEKE